MALDSRLLTGLPALAAVLACAGEARAVAETLELFPVHLADASETCLAGLDKELGPGNGY